MRKSGIGSGWREGGCEGGDAQGDFLFDFLVDIFKGLTELTKRILSIGDEQMVGLDEAGDVAVSKSQTDHGGDLVLARGEGGPSWG